MSAVLNNDGYPGRSPDGLPAEASPPAGSARSLSLKTRLIMLVATAIVFLIGMSAWQVYSQRRMALDDNTTELVGIVNGARSIVDHFYQLSKKGEMSEAEAQAGAKRALQGFIYPGQSGDRDYIVVIDGQGVTIMHATTPGQVGNVSLSGDVAAGIRARMAEIKAKGYAVEFRQLKKPGTDKVQPKMNIYVAFEPWGWMIGSGSFADTLQAKLQHDMWISVGVSAVLIMALLLAAMLAARGVLRQIGGEPAEVVTMMNRAARGDLAQDTRAAAPGSVVHAFGLMLKQLGRLVQQVRDEAAAMRTDAERIAESVGQVSEAASQQSDATSSMAASVEELTVSVASISDAASQTQHNSEGVADKCREGESKVLGSAEGMKRIASAVSEASNKIKGLEERAVQINSIAASIKEIAGQTNLLALNAAIEAARAGDQGRGFSVVADEVRKLAERTASATIEIEEMVNAVQRETNESTATMNNVLPLVTEGVQLADQVAQSLRSISESANESLDRVREVAHATKEQSAASTSIAQQVEGIAQMVEETTAAMGATAASARDMRQMAERLDKLVGAFKV